MLFFTNRPDLQEAQPDMPLLTKTDKALIELSKGNKVIGAKDFSIVFYITCMLPFYRLSTPQIKPHDLKKAKRHQRLIGSEIGDAKAVKS